MDQTHGFGAVDVQTNVNVQAHVNLQARSDVRLVFATPGREKQSCMEVWFLTVQPLHRILWKWVQGYLAHKKQRPPRTLQ